MNFSVFITGMTMGLSLIMAIGAQNAFVLRQGLKGQHILPICLICALSDTILIVLGVTSFGRISAVLPWIDPVMRYGGAAFLIWYGAKSLRAAFTSNEILTATGEGANAGLAATVAMCLALTWLNPHVYLDTVVLLGSIASQFGDQKTAFALGASMGSFLFFFALGYGATRLRPVFARPSAWRILEGLVAVMMWTIAAKLIFGG